MHDAAVRSHNWRCFFARTRSLELEVLLHLRSTCRDFMHAVESHSRPRVELWPAWSIAAGDPLVDVAAARARMLSKLRRSPPAMVARVCAVESDFVSESVDLSELGARDVVVLGDRPDARNLPLRASRVSFVVAPSVAVSIPPSVTGLSIGWPGGWFDARSLPATLVELEVAFAHVGSLDARDLPVGLTSLTVRHACVDSFDERDLPRSIRSLAYGRSHVGAMALGDLPSGLTELTLPDSTTAWAFDASLLPRGLAHLRFGPSFDRPVVARDLPRGLWSLEFGVGFRGVVRTADLPRALRRLHLGGAAIRPADFADLPRGLVRLSVGRVSLAPASELDLSALPRRVARLDLGDEFDAPIAWATLPPCLRALRLGRSYDRDVDAAALPAGLRALDLGPSYRRRVDGRRLPRGLRSLVLGCEACRLADVGDLPPELACFYVGCVHEPPCPTPVAPVGLTDFAAAVDTVRRNRGRGPSQ